VVVGEEDTGAAVHWDSGLSERIGFSLHISQALERVIGRVNGHARCCV
jgi:hypothetical protein